MGELKNEIQEFLTSRRARLTPGQVGLELDGSARRVPGLRRAEVADLAGISVEYYITLERGNLRNASDDVIASLARALRLDQDEHRYLSNLAHASRGGAQTGPPPAEQVSARIQKVLDGFTAGPVWVRNEYMDVLGTNALARALYDPIFRALPDRPSTARHVYLVPGAREFWVDHDYYAEAFAAKLRMEKATHASDPRLTSLIEELDRESESFRRHWANAEVTLFRSGVKRFRHPAAGRLDLHFETFDVASAPGLIMSVYQPNDAASAARLTALAEWSDEQGF